MADKTKVLQVMIYDGETQIGNMLAVPRTFRTGSRGWLATGKVDLDASTRLQTTASFVVIGSRPDAKNNKPRKA